MSDTGKNDHIPRGIVNPTTHCSVSILLDEACLRLADARAKWEASGGPARLGEIFKKLEENPWPEDAPEICGKVNQGP